MNRKSLAFALAAGVAAFVATGSRADELPSQARTILKKYCAVCHNGPGSKGGSFDALKDDSMHGKADDDEHFYVVAGKPNESYLLERLEKNSMPPKNITARPTPAEIAIVRQWIAAGAKLFPAAEARQATTQRAAMAVMRDYLRKLEPEDRQFQRFFTLHHLSNNPGVAAADLRVQRAALSKALNSLSWKPRMVLPKALDASQTLFALDLRDLDWDKDNLWNEILKLYPYGLRYDKQSDAELRDIDQELERETKTAIPFIRADWFVTTATRPPLYHTLLQIPRTAGELEKQLRVDVIDNLRRDRAARGGFRGSGVSAQNRLVERHDSLHGAYWKSYDFKPGKTKGDLARFPLGPVFRDNPFEQLAFEHDGGEIIFTLPNGLQGYMLVDGKDNRIDQGPEEVVFDSQNTLGSPAIVNGQSCMACHSTGMRTFTDQLRDGSGVFGDAQRKVRRLFPEAEAMKKIVAQDSQRFMAAMELAVGPFLRDGANDKPDLAKLPDPVGEVVFKYRRTNLHLAAVAAELDVTPEELKAAITGNRRLQELGLAPLLHDKGTVQRQEWDTVGRSLMQRVAVELGKGSPERVVK